MRQRFAVTERDEATGLDHTWFRKYDNFAGRWTSPDPLTGATGNPQTFNLYAYTTNDPVNKIDPSGLRPCVPGEISAECGSSGPAGWGWRDISGGNRDFRPGQLTILLRERMFDMAWGRNNRLYSRWLETFGRRWASEFIIDPFGGYNSQDIRAIKEVTDCDRFAAEVARIGFENVTVGEFVQALEYRFAPEGESLASDEFGSSGFKTNFQDPEPTSANQARHYVGALKAQVTFGRLGRHIMNSRETVSPGDTEQVRQSHWADLALNAVAFEHGKQLTNDNYRQLHSLIRRDVCQ